MASHDDMALLPGGDPMSVDGAVQGINVMDPMQGMDGIGAMNGMDPMPGMEGMDAAMQGMQGMQDMDGIAMSLDEVDLFGDPVINNPLDALPARPSLSKPLQLRLEELRSRGSCQGIAWSRHGTIASISKDGMSVELRFLRSNPQTADWQLSEPSFWAPAPAHPAPSPSGSASPVSTSAPFVHLAWAPSSNPDLAVIDALGRLTLLSFHLSINQTCPVRRWETDLVDHLHKVVGCYWLPTQIPGSKQHVHLIHGPAIRSQSDRNQPEYKYEHQVYPAHGPFHPHPGKSAFLCVTTNGALRLFFTQINGRLEETSIELESVNSCDELITHAALCSEKNNVLIALATASKQLRIVRASIHWGLPPADKQVPPGGVPLRPSLREFHVDTASWAQHGSQEPAADALSTAQLTHIEILSSAPAGHGQPLSPPVVLMVRSCVSSDGSLYDLDCQTIIDRWEIVNDQPQSLSPAFQQLGTMPSKPPQMPRLRRLDPIMLPKVVVTITTALFGRIICLGFSDGTVQYRDRFTFDEVYHEQNTDAIMHPLQLGFRFPEPTPCLQVAFSPTNCSFVQMCEDAALQWNQLQCPMDGPNLALETVDQKAVIVALTIALSASALSQVTCDDILAMARPLAQLPDFAASWIRETVNILKITVDYSEETHHDQLIRNILLQMCLSMLGHLHFRGEFKPRPPEGKFATLALAIRNIFLVLTVALNSPPMGKLVPLDDLDVVEAVTGCTRWGISLLGWITDSLFELLDDPEIMAKLNDPKRFPELARYLHSKGDVALQLMLCSSTRGFLSATCRRLMQVESVSNRTSTYYENLALQLQQDPAAAANVPRPAPALLQAYQRMARAVAAPLVRVADFERLLSELSGDIQASYRRSLAGLNAAKVKPQHANMTEQQQQQLNEQFIKKATAHCELDMLLGKNPPPSFREVLLKFFTATLPAFRSQTDPARLFFADYSLLEVAGADDNAARVLHARKAEGRYVDAFKRVELVVPPRCAKATTAGPRTANGDEPRNAAAAGSGAAGSSGTAANIGGSNNNNNHSNNGGGGGGGGSGNNNSSPWAPSISYGAWTPIGGTKGVSPCSPSPGNGNAIEPQWRRCVRCAAVMEDIWSGKPGFNFVLTQQRKCVCGGGWGTMPKGL
ncbi:hypothetical protein VTJ83DRAFT_2148 [Remersonia thermophila]|uniref:Mediator of RNA polymerase II transcription subunit 16 n=1 Tax=Remersonia thermophila TaxID=72144 RepID=A0ABR4DI23_9PEZI